MGKIIAEVDAGEYAGSLDRKEAGVNAALKNWDACDNYRKRREKEAVERRKAEEFKQNMQKYMHIFKSIKSQSWRNSRNPFNLNPPKGK